MPPDDNEFNEWRRALSSLSGQVAVLEAGHKAIIADLATKHKQNREDIHNFRDSLQSITDKFFLKMEDLKELVTDLRLQTNDIKAGLKAKDGIWKYFLTLGSGVLTAILIEAWHGIHK